MPPLNLSYMGTPTATYNVWYLSWNLLDYGTHLSFNPLPTTKRTRHHVLKYIA